MTPEWDTSCKDWEQRLLAGQSIIPCGALFPEQAAACMRIFRDLILKDVPGSPTIGDVSPKWVFDFVNAFFGSYDHASLRRFITEYLLLISKKNIKSTLAAAIMVTMLIRNWRHSGEFIILAPTKDIADNSFTPARDMIEADSDLSTILHVQEHYRTITHRVTKATLKVIAADNEAVGGTKAIGVLVDELWQFGNRAKAEGMLREACGGLASRPEGFVIYLTSQSEEAPKGIFAQKLTYFRKVRDGKIKDNHSLPVLFEFPERMLKDESYQNPDNFYMTNPSLGSSVDTDYLIREAEKAKLNGEASYRIFASKHLNVEIGVALRSDGWAGAEHWEKAIDPTITFDTILSRSEVITIGIDGGGLDDLLGVALIGRDKVTKNWLVWTHAFISPEGEKRRLINATQYEQFKADGDLTRVDRLPDDLREVSKIVKRVKSTGLLACVGVDAIGIGGIVDAMDDIEVTEDDGTLRSIRQGISLMGAIKTVERKAADGTLQHGGQRLMSWAVGNAIIVYTPTAIRLSRDETGAGKIDTLAALFDAAELMMTNPSAKSKERQLMFFGAGARPARTTRHTTA